MNITECLNDLPSGIIFPNGMVAVDCEMMGLNVHRDRLCLVQVGDGEGNVWLVQFDGVTWNAPNLCAMLTDSRLLKLFHYGRKDLVTLYHYLGIMTSPVYDTKIASKFARTYTEGHGLRSCVKECLGVDLDKSITSTNWGAAELSDTQKKYATEDVLYLHQLKEHLDAQLKQENRLHLAQMCFDFLPSRVAIDLAGWEDIDMFAHR